jgi:type IX secretion system PorP/SprF family membrane protein
MKLLKKLIIVLFLLASVFMKAQETLPIYSDYLSDNVFLVHPSAAGIGNCSKIRLTARSQWAGIDDSPTLQTLTAHGRVGENIGVGVILFNDSNGYHAQQGIEATFAYHINLGRPDDANQLSFALAFMAVNNTVDESQFTIFDPIISQIVQSEAYFNADFSIAYHNKGFFSYFTAKNIMLSARTLYDNFYESLNLRRYVLTVGYYFGADKKYQFEPSIMAQAVERTGEKFVDFNIKAYKDFENAQLWIAFSYRQGFDRAVNVGQELQYFTPIIGINYKKFMFSYTYTKQTGNILFDDAGYNQITLGYNFGCRTPRNSGCPNLNYAF